MHGNYDELNKYVHPRYAAGARRHVDVPMSEYEIPITGVDELTPNFHPHLIPEMGNPRKYTMEDFTNIFSVDSLLKLLIIAFVIGLLVYLLNVNRSPVSTYSAEILPTASATIQSASLMRPV